MYENINLNLELGYITNFIDEDTCKKGYTSWENYDKKDAWKAQLIFIYKF